MVCWLTAIYFGMTFPARMYKACYYHCSGSKWYDLYPPSINVSYDDACPPTYTFKAMK